MNTEETIKQLKQSNEEAYQEFCAATVNLSDTAGEERTKFLAANPDKTEANYVAIIAENFLDDIFKNPTNLKYHTRCLAVALTKMAKLREQMKQAAQVFRLYEELHKTRDNAEKAQQNRDMAKKCEESLL
jgi:hypothetical protein